MTNDGEVFFVGGCLEVRRDGIEVGVRGPGRARGQPCASLSQLTLAELVRSVDEMQFMLGVRALEEFPEPLTLSSGIAGKVEND